LDSERELYRHFIVCLNGIVKKHGRQTIVWEGFHRDGKTAIPNDILVMAFEGGKYYRPDHLVEDGYTIINASWQPASWVDDGGLLGHHGRGRTAPLMTCSEA
jgi:hexosaminidase